MLMRPFRDQTFSSRYHVLGDIAQDAFYNWAAANDVRIAPFGFNRPPFRFFSHLPALLRQMPDYICEVKPDVFEDHARHVLIEVKGFGKDQVLKIKCDSIEVLQQWQQWSGCPVRFFVFDSYHSRYSTQLSLDYFLTTLRDSVMISAFTEESGAKKPFYAIPAEALQWQPLGRQMNTADDPYRAIVRQCRALIDLTERLPHADGNHLSALSRTLLYIAERHVPPVGKGGEYLRV